MSAIHASRVPMLELLSHGFAAVGNDNAIAFGSPPYGLYDVIPQTSHLLRKIILIFLSHCRCRNISE